MCQLKSRIKYSSNLNYNVLNNEENRFQFFFNFFFQNYDSEMLHIIHL